MNNLFMYLQVIMTITIPVSTADTLGVTQEGEANNFDDSADAQDTWVFPWMEEARALEQTMELIQTGGAQSLFEQQVNEMSTGSQRVTTDPHGHQDQPALSLFKLHHLAEPQKSPQCCT